MKKAQFSVSVGVYLQRNILKNGMYQLYGNEKQKRLSTGKQRAARHERFHRIFIAYGWSGVHL